MNENDIDVLINGNPYNDKDDIIIDFSCVGCKSSYVVNQSEDKFTFFVTQSNIEQLQTVLDNDEYNTFVFQDDTYNLTNPLIIKRSEIVLKGQATTKLVWKNKNQQEPHCISIKGDKWFSKRFPRIEISDDYVPVGSTIIQVSDKAKLSVNDNVRVVRRGNAQWIAHIGMDNIPMRPDGLDVTQWKEFDLEYDRKIKGIHCEKGNMFITLDAPIPCSIDKTWGGGCIYKYNDARIKNIVITDLTIITDNNMSIGVFMDNTINVLIKNVITENCDRLHTIGRGSKYTTIDSCTYNNPSSPLKGGNRHAFHIQGQLNLLKNCHANNSRHAFSIDAGVCGPNVIYMSSSDNDFAASEPHHRWSVGTLFDNVRSTIYIQNRLWMGSGHGWSGANYITWNCEGEICCQKPPTADNFVIGHVGKKYIGAFPSNPQGTFISYGHKVSPSSLFEHQLKK
jgi:hypothetical protein